MALDETGMKGGWALKEWYEKRGFEMGGHLKKVGRKFDRWYVQTQQRSPREHY
jgi:phosphinothricin acetyltransferase